MEHNILPSPASQAAQPLSRPPLQDASGRLNQSPAKLAPIGSVKGGLANEQAAQKLPTIVPPKAASATTKATTSASAKATASKKRKAAPETTLAEDIAAYKQKLDHIDVDRFYVDMTCAQVRSRINLVLDGGIMKKGEFCDAIGSSNRSVNTFLQKRGSDGTNTESYINAWIWFKQREIAGLKMPDVKRKQKAEAAAAAAAGGARADPGTGPASKKTKTAAALDLPDLSQIYLDGEEDDTVPVFDSCDEIRKKIAAHLKTPGLTQAQFCRDLFAQLQAPKCKSIQSKSLSEFRGKKGPIAGCTSSVFYSAYVYFEKLRIAKGKAKSNHRMEMEIIHGDEGLDRERDGRSGYLVPAGTSLSMDPYGRVHLY